MYVGYIQLCRTEVLTCGGPIIFKLTDIHETPFIRSFIENLPRGTGFGISDDFLKEVNEVRKQLCTVFKAAKPAKLHLE